MNISDLSKKIREAASVPLYRNGLALVMSLMTTSGLGIVYWALAARNYSPEAVGINSAIISAMGLLANASQFGLVNFLTRFLPRAGKRTPYLILYSYVFSVSIGLLVSIVFVVGINIWSPSLYVLRKPVMFVGFVLATVFWCVFALQDGVLTGIRQTTWVPIENTFYALAKIGLLVLFSKVFIDFGIYYSWVAPVFLITVVINIILFRTFVPKHREETESSAERYTIPQIIRFVGGDYLSTIVWMATTNLMPLIIIERMGPEINAYFYFPWMITYSLYMVSRNLGMSLTVEAAKDQSRLAEYARRSLSQSAVLLVPIVLVTVVGAHWILEIFGHNYSVEGEALLRLLALSALPYMIISLYVSIARVQQKVFRIVITLSVLCLLAVGLTLFWVDRLGLAGIGWAWLLSQTFVACMLLATGLKALLFKSKSTGAVSRNAVEN